MKERSGMPYDVVAYESDDLAMALTEAEEGLFHRMMRRSWMNGSIPSDLVLLSSVCRTHHARLKKAWIKIAPLWKPHPTLHGRLINLKQEQERVWVETKSESSKRAANVRHHGVPENDLNSNQKRVPRDPNSVLNTQPVDKSDNILINKEIEVANALRTQSGRIASPSPPLPVLSPFSNTDKFLSSTSLATDFKTPSPEEDQKQQIETLGEPVKPATEREEGPPPQPQGTKSGKYGPPPQGTPVKEKPEDPAVAVFESAYMALNGAKYPRKTADFVKLAELRKYLGIGTRDVPNGWDLTVVNYFASVDSEIRTLADLANPIRYNIFKTKKLDQYGKANSNGGNGNGQHRETPLEGRLRRAAETADSIRKRLGGTNTQDPADSGNIDEIRSLVRTGVDGPDGEGT